MVSMIIDGKEYNIKSKKKADYIKKKHKIMFHKNEIQKLEFECALMLDDIVITEGKDEHPF